MPARFKKAMKAPLFDFDGWDEDGGYQMVPAGGDLRFLAVSSGARGGTLTNGNSNIVRMERFSSTVPLTTATIDRAVLPPNAEVEFALNGLAAAGRTTLTLTNPDGKEDDALTISVKTVRKVKLSVCVLADIRRRAAFDGSMMTTFIAAASKTYKQQANVELVIENGPEDILVEKDLKDPLFPEKQDILEAIHDATPKKFFSSDIVIYGTWNISALGKKPNIVGIRIGKKVLIENNNSFFQNASTFAHEIGHALGLAHVTDGRCIMFPDSGPATSKFRQFEIDHINTSGV